MKTVIEMAREADIEWDLIDEDEGRVWYITQAGLDRFANLVRADERNSWPAEMEAMERQVNILTDALAQEREACAKVCDDMMRAYWNTADGEGPDPDDCAAAIRARSNP